MGAPRDILFGELYKDAGDTDEGEAWLFCGGIHGWSADWTADSGQENANFGMDVAGAGDVNGDGFCNVIVGAPAWDLGQIDEGRGYLFYGNNGRGLARTVQQERTDHGAPIASINPPSRPSRCVTCRDAA